MIEHSFKNIYNKKLVHYYLCRQYLTSYALMIEPNSDMGGKLLSFNDYRKIMIILG